MILKLTKPRLAVKTIYIMKKEMREKLEANGRYDLIEIFEINKSGYAGILPNGNIVSRLQFPEAIPVQKNGLLSIPEPKKLKPEIKSEYVCIPCGSYFIDPSVEKEFSIDSMFEDVCAICGQEMPVKHIRHFNYLNHYKYNQSGKAK